MVLLEVLGVLTGSSFPIELLASAIARAYLPILHIFLCIPPW